MRILVALGGNALLRRGEPADAETQRAHVRDAATALARLAGDHELIVTHGNGPQVGLLALQAEAYPDVPPYPLDVLGAETEGMIGYLIEQELGNALPQKAVATLLTQVLVDAGDPAFEHPTKPIGPVYDEAGAARVAGDRGWTLAPDGAGWRRVVASPEPREVMELSTIGLLLDAGVVVICAGGGGIPVTRDSGGRLRGAQAVIDKDLSAALLAVDLGCDALLLLTDAPAVMADWGSDRARPVAQVTTSELRSWRLDAGSMGPKAEAACRFADAGGRIAAIGALEDAAEMLEGRAGTRVTRGCVNGAVTSSPRTARPADRLRSAGRGAA